MFINIQLLSYYEFINLFNLMTIYVFADMKFIDKLICMINKISLFFCWSILLGQLESRLKLYIRPAQS